MILIRVGIGGKKQHKKLIDRYPSLINTYIPDEYKSKDPSDLYFNHGEKNK